MRHTECPRCGVLLRPVRLATRENGPYRDAAVQRDDEQGWQCPSCRAGVVPRPLVDRLMKNMAIGGAATERERKTTRSGCPGCFGNLDAVLLTWGTSCVEIEQCAKCRAMVLDPGELPKLFAIEEGAGQQSA